LASLSLRAVAKAYGRDRVVHGIDLDVADGEFVVLVGPSGCGKSTTLRMIAGLEAITSGTIRIGERAVNDMHPADRDVAMVFQSYALYPHMSVYDNLAYGLRRRQVAKREIDRRVSATAAMLKLEALLGRRPAQLSGGQRQRVALGRAIVREPAVFLMDEPLSNLDAKLRVEMRGELARLHAELGVTTVYVTHDQVEAMTMGDRIVVMNAGRIEQSGRPLDLYRQPASLFVASFLGLPEINLIRGNVGTSADRVEFSADVLAASLPLVGTIRAGPAILGIRPQALTGHRSSEATMPGISLGAARVLAVEHHGPQSFATCRLKARALTVEIGPASGIAIGDEIGISADLSDLHLFDPGTGQRLAAG
jgi:sn-glycerol 3-phosphate transport system ATP-binding protein